MRISRTVRYLTLAAGVTGFAVTTPAQQAVSGPSLGLLHDRAGGELLPILGIPGAAHLGSPLPLPEWFVTLAVSPENDYFAGVAQESGVSYIGRPFQSPLAVREIPEAIRFGDRIAISSGGSAAAVLSGETRQVQLLRRLPDNPVAGPPISLDFTADAVTALAVAESGDAVLVATSGRDGYGAVYRLRPGGEPLSLGAVAKVVALAFVGESDDALAADYGRREVVLFRKTGSGGERLSLLGRADGLARPVGVAVTSDGLSAVVADDEGRVAVAPLGGGAPVFLDCECRPDGVAPLAGGALFRLSGDPALPLAVLDARGGAGVEQLRMMYVPALPGRISASPQQPDAPLLAPRARRSGRE